MYKIPFQSWLGWRRKLIETNIVYIKEYHLVHAVYMIERLHLYDRQIIIIIEVRILVFLHIVTKREICLSFTKHQAQEQDLVFI